MKLYLYSIGCWIVAVLAVFMYADAIVGYVVLTTPVENVTRGPVVPTGR